MELLERRIKTLSRHNAWIQNDKPSEGSVTNNTGNTHLMYRLIENIHLEGSVSQIVGIGLSFNSM